MLAWLDFVRPGRHPRPHGKFQTGTNPLPAPGSSLHPCSTSQPGVTLPCAVPPTPLPRARLPRLHRLSPALGPRRTARLVVGGFARADRPTAPGRFAAAPAAATRVAGAPATRARAGKPAHRRIMTDAPGCRRPAAAAPGGPRPRRDCHPPARRRRRPRPAWCPCSCKAARTARTRRRAPACE